MNRGGALLASLTVGCGVLPPAAAQDARKLHRIATLGFGRGGGDLSGPPTTAKSLSACVRGMRALGYRYGQGARPGDRPVEQPTRFELMVHRKTARALGIKIPQSLLLQADGVTQ